MIVASSQVFLTSAALTMWFSSTTAGFFVVLLVQPARQIHVPFSSLMRYGFIPSAIAPVEMSFSRKATGRIPLYASSGGLIFMPRTKSGVSGAGQYSP